MDEPKIKFGDKIFVYGQFMKYLSEIDEYEYNTVMGYMTVDGYFVRPIATDIFGAAIPGFVTEILLDEQFTVAAPFNNMEMIDVTEKLSLQYPSLYQTKVWMPVTSMV